MPGAMHIHRTHRLGIDEARRRVGRLAGELGGQFHLESRWEGNELHLQGRGLHGTVSVTEDSVDIRLRLGLALAMLGTSIRSTIESRIDDYIA